MTVKLEATRTRRRTAEDVHLGCMLALTFSTGIADAVGYLGLDKVFAGNMTGNVVVLGMGASGTVDLPVLGPLLGLLAFMAGAMIGGRAMRRQPTGWTRRSAHLIAAVGIVFAVAAAVFAVSSVHQGSVIAYVMTAALASAMGLQASLARLIAVKDVTTVVVTSTLTGLAADSRWGSGSPQPWLRRAAAIVLICAGAAVGALLLQVSPSLSVAVPAALTITVAVVGDVLVGREQESFG